MDATLVCVMFFIADHVAKNASAISRGLMEEEVQKAAQFKNL